ncbi:MAG TPA: response regulator [Terriglobales bacterium]|nr:response regulator [Terriglobales bacterium]
MELRRHDREDTRHQVAIWSLDSEGKIYVQEGYTVDVSNSGACLGGLNRRIEPGSLVGVQNGTRRGRFKVVWTERDGERAHQVGIERVASDTDGPTRVLLVDDSRESIEARKPILQALGYECSTASSASSLFDSLQNTDFKVVVLSHPLREVDSIELLVGLRRTGSRAKVVVVSAHPHVHESLRSVTDAFVYAREPQASLVAAIEKALDHIPSKLLTTRTIHRHAVKVPLVVEVLRSGVKTNLYGASADLSERGIGGSIKAPLIPGEMVKVIFPLPNATNEIQAYAIVRHRRSEFYGFEFVSIDDKSLDIIRNLCAVLPALRNS